MLALEVVEGEVPVIHDSHDLQSLRRTPYEDGFDDPDDPDALERAAVEGCAALVAVSAEMLAAIAARHRPPPLTLLFANYALARDVTPFPRAGRRDGPLRVVYQGSLSANGSHYDLREGFAALAATGIEIDVFPNRDAPEYRELAARTPGMRLMETLEPAALLRRLPAYDVGWAVFNPRLNAAHLDTALPNKAFEYLASGLPIAAGPHAALRRLVEDRGVGVVVEDLADLPEALTEAPLAAMRRRALADRAMFTVEGHIGELVGLYRAGRRRRRRGLTPAGPGGPRSALHCPPWTTSWISGSSPSIWWSSRARRCRSTSSSRATASSTRTACSRTGRS